ncbi:hypothetical protein CSAL01_11635 [Colletotrichum salicis]|uniref:Uncharacterized protein n=1 Tax=Colletotrichum salicis TaxID=1209931 RepID=A0A135SCR5_9PEZI|nr:hypothetical protein CSAL01_11635 [Colletotrichum salicis]
MISFAPDEDETPRWSPDPTTTVGHDEALRTVLGVAAESGDVWMQATCLQLLIYQCPEPRILLHKLDSLWLSAGTHQRHLETRLYCYIPEAFRTTKDRDSLQREILLFARASSQRLKPYAEYMILRALAPREEEKEAYLERAMDALNSSFQGYVPHWNTQMPTENQSAPKTTGHDWTDGNIPAHPYGPYSSWQDLSSGPSQGTNYVGAKHHHTGYAPAHGNKYAAGTDPFKQTRTTAHPGHIGFPPDAPDFIPHGGFESTGGAHNGPFGPYLTSFGNPYAQNQFPLQPPPPPPPPPPFPASGPTDWKRRHFFGPGTKTKMNNSGSPEQANNQAGSDNREQNEPPVTSSSDQSDISDSVFSESDVLSELYFNITIPK